MPMHLAGGLDDISSNEQGETFKQLVGMMYDAMFLSTLSNLLEWCMLQCFSRHLSRPVRMMIDEAFRKMHQTTVQTVIDEAFRTDASNKNSNGDWQGI